MPKDSYAMFIHSFPVRLLGVLMNVLGVLQSLSGVFLPGWVILLLMSLCSSAVRMGCIIVQFGGSLMILVV